MQSRRVVPALLVALAGPAAAGPQEDVLTFPVSQCRYTLPGKDWTWIDHTSFPKAICAARNGDDLVFVLSVIPWPAGPVIDEKFAAEYDRTADPSVTKRDGRIATLKGLPCYESEWLASGKRTGVIRVVIANGYFYKLQLLGNADPVEKRPDFEAIMNGFEFTSPPVPPVPAEPLDPGKKLARRMGQVAVYCLLGALVLGLVVRGARKK
jgi:hypothetical protein